MFCILVPSEPVGLTLRLIGENPPVVAVTWGNPRRTFGDLQEFKLTYGILGDDGDTEGRRFEPDKYRFTTGFLGMTLKGDRKLVL